MYGSDNEIFGVRLVVASFIHLFIYSFIKCEDSVYIVN